MRCASAVVAAAGIDITRVGERLFEQLEARLGGEPAWVLLAHDVAVDGAALGAACRSLRPATALHRLSSCEAVLDAEGHHRGPVAAAFGLRELGSACGSAAQGFASDSPAEIATATAAALDLAMSRAGRRGEAPHLLFLSTVPGAEEQVLAAIEAEIGPVPVAGGSAADDRIDGGWSVGDGERSFGSGLVLSALYPRQSPSFAFSSGYVETGICGTITAAQGRTIRTIDGEPAARIYDRWTGGLLSGLEGPSSAAWSPKTETQVLESTTLAPLGRRLGPGDDQPCYLLSHPANMHTDGSLSLFTTVETGERLELMRGSPSSLQQRAAVVVQQVRAQSQHPVSGAIVVYCAACMLALGDAITDVPRPLADALGAPFLGVFTFGEQGSLSRQAALHGNLMISVVAFHG
jgi:hypothetical protein